MENNREFRFPAEFEQHAAIWIAWPVFEYKRGLSAVPMYIEIIRTLTPHVRVKIQVNDAASRINVERLLMGASINMNQVTFHDVPHDDIWVRDPGPIFVVDNNKKKKMVLMDFDCYGYESADSPHSMLAKHANELIATELQIDTITSELIGEGAISTFNHAHKHLLTVSTSSYHHILDSFYWEIGLALLHNTHSKISGLFLIEIKYPYLF